MAQARKPKTPVRDYGPGYVNPSKQQIDINVSTGRPSAKGSQLSVSPEQQRRMNSTFKRLQDFQKRNPNRVSLTGQGPSDFYGLGRDDISQIVASRLPAMSEKQLERLRKAAALHQPDNPDQYVADRQAKYESRVVGGGKEFLRPGVPNRSLTSQAIVDDIIRKYDAGQHNLKMDEIAGGTQSEVAKAMREISTTRPEIMKGMSFYLAGGPKTRVDKWNPLMTSILKKSHAPVYVQMYGGRGDQRWDDQDWSNATDKFRSFRDAGIEARPLMSFSDKNIGTGPQAIREAKRRAYTIFKNTGYIPSVWHATSMRSPSPEGLGNQYTKWVEQMRRKG